jgi:hypothetical protein
MKKRSVKKLKLSTETLTRMDLKEAAGAASQVNCTGFFSAAYTNCPLCGNTNYFSCPEITCNNCTV